MRFVETDTREEYVLSTGRRFYANGGILGLSSFGARQDSISEGYDGGVDFGTDPLTTAERHEIAQFMIALWRKWGGL